MLANPVLRTSLSFPRMLLIPFMPITTFVISIGLLIPILYPLYALIMSIIWLPFSCYIKITSWIYREVWVFRPILALITIPILIVLDIFIIIMPGANKHDKYEKASMIDSWPCKSKHVSSDSSKEQSIPKNRKASSCSIDMASSSRVKVKECTLCGDMVRADWTQCPSCHEPLDAVLPLPSTRYTKVVLNKNQVSQRWVDEHYNKSMPWIKECTLCGDIVRANWRECPRCGEALIHARPSVMAE